jgi:2-phosphoglycerate kinase
MIYLLGGPPRVGKSIISKTITKKYGINVVSTDSLGAVLENVLDPEVDPGLFIVNRFNEMATVDKINLMVENTTERINYQIEEGCAVWKAVKPFILREKDEGRDVVVEGVAVLPELVNQLENVDYRVVFIGNQGDEHKENIKKSAKENEYDWMRYVSNEYIDAFATFVVKMSSYIEKEAHKYGFEYIEMDGRPFYDTVGRIMDSLFVKSER